MIEKPKDQKSKIILKIMKQCPACKSVYTDDSLSFCLNDGAALVVAPSTSSEITQQLSYHSNQTRENSPPPTRLEFQSETPTVISVPKNTTQTEHKGFSPLAVIAIILLLAVVGIAGIAAAYFAFVKKDEPKIISQTNSSPLATPEQNNNSNETQKLKDELEKLKKEVRDQKNSKSDAATSNNPAQSESGIVTATVNSPGDGFLSLRTEPSVKTGTQLVKIPTGAKVQIEDCQRNFQTIDSRRGRWCMVTYNEQLGWVFDAWLVY